MVTAQLSAHEAKEGCVRTLRTRCAMRTLTHTRIRSWAESDLEPVVLLLTREIKSARAVRLFVKCYEEQTLSGHWQPVRFHSSTHLFYSAEILYFLNRELSFCSFPRTELQLERSGRRETFFLLGRRMGPE